MHPPNGRNGHNGHDNYDPEDLERHDDVLGEDAPELPPEPVVPAGQVVSTDSNGTQIIMPRSLGGRPSKRNEQAKRRIVTAIRLGVTFKLAAAYGGMSYDAFQEWRHDDEDFNEEVQRAIGVAAAQWMNIIENAAKLDWRAAAWKLQHRFPTEYGRQVNELSGPNGGPVQIREVTVRIPDTFGVDDHEAFDEGPPDMMLPSDTE